MATSENIRHAIQAQRLTDELVEILRVHRLGKVSCPGEDLDLSESKKASLLSNVLERRIQIEAHLASITET